MISFKKATIEDIPQIREIAFETWPKVYEKIISGGQIQYMLDLFYAEAVLQKNITQQQHHFLLVLNEEKACGFAGFEHHFLQQAVTRLHKLYVLPEFHGAGLGRALLEQVIGEARDHQSKKIALNVNKYNPALSFYKKLQFEVVAAEKLPIGEGFFMDDFVMERKLH